jgi:hypothetical protein
MSFEQHKRTDFMASQKNTKSISKTWIGAVLMSTLLSGCGQASPKYPPPSIDKVVDLSKAGVIHEQKFTVPSNRRWAPEKLEFGQSHTNYEISLKFSDAELNRRIRHGSQPYFENEEARRKRDDEISPILVKIVGIQFSYPDIDEIPEEQWRVIPPVMKQKGLPVQLKLTLTPLGNVKESIDYLEGPYLYRTPTEKWRKKSNRGKSIEVILDLSTYGRSSTALWPSANKLLLEFQRLQIGGDYQLRIENLNPQQLPPSIEAELVMGLGRWKY